MRFRTRKRVNYLAVSIFRILSVRENFKYFVSKFNEIVWRDLPLPIITYPLLMFLTTLRKPQYVYERGTEFKNTTKMVPYIPQERRSRAYKNDWHTQKWNNSCQINLENNMKAQNVCASHLYARTSMIYIIHNIRCVHRSHVVKIGVCCSV